LHRKFETNIPRNETVQPHSQCLRSCICERFIYSHNLSAYFAVLRLRTDRGKISIAQKYMNIKSGNNSAQLYFWEYCSNFRYSVLTLHAVFT
jgi:hypothetical protein